MFKFVILAVLISFTEATKVSSCGNRIPMPDAVRISGCSAEPCQIVKGTTVIFEVDFTVPSFTTSLKGYVSYTLFLLTSQFDLPPGVSNVCANLLNGVTCPLYARQSATYAISFNTDKYPTLSTKFQVSMKDQNDDVVACFSLKASVVNP